MKGLHLTQEVLLRRMTTDGTEFRHVFKGFQPWLDVSLIGVIKGFQPWLDFTDSPLDVIKGFQPLAAASIFRIIHGEKPE